MTDSFFVPSFGNRPKHLVGRELVLNRFEQIFQSVPGSRERSVLLLGQRGSGKTVLLLELAEMARKRGFVVSGPTVVAKGMQTRIIEKIRDEHPDYMSDSPKSVTGGNLSVFGFGAGIQFNDRAPIARSFAWNIAEICKKANAEKHGVLILIDEVHPNSEELRELVIAYQEMVGSGLDVAIVFAGLPVSISSLLNDHVLTFLNRAEKIHLPLLRIADIELYYEKAFKTLGISISKTMTHRAAEASCGSPYLMQLIGHYMTLNSERVLSESLFDDSLEVARTVFKNDICCTTLATLSKQDMNFLSAMASLDDECTMDDIAIKMGKGPSFVQTYKRRLIQSGIIESPGRGRVVFAVPYLRDYLRDQNHSFDVL